MSLVCKFGLHSWNGCKCSKCEKTRDVQHDWNGCICIKCSKTRDDNHSWDGCKCSKCGKKRDEQHDWRKNCEKCSICNTQTNGLHVFNDECECTKCGVIAHKWDNDHCIRCNIMMPKKRLSNSDSSCILYFRNSKERDSAYRIMTSIFLSCFYHIERRNVYNRKVMYYHWIVCDENAYNTEIQRYINNAGCYCPESQYVNYWLVIKDSDSCD